MFRGLTDLMAGLHLLWGDRQLRALLWRMVGLLALLMVAAAVGGFWLAETVAAAWMPTGEAWYWQLLAGLAWLFSALFAFVMALLVYLSLATAVVAPWLESVALRAALLRGEHLSARESQGGVALVLQATANVVRPLLGLVLCGLAALLLWWIPLLGPLLAGAVWAYGSLRFLCFELLDTHASLLAWDFSQRRDYLRQHRWYWLGFGGSAALALMVPLLNLLVLPAAVAGLRMDHDAPRQREVDGPVIG
ncbi:MAG: EI24 domain-containing protein [Mariprofundales bacterium]